MMTTFQSKHHIGKALAESLGIAVQTTATGQLTAESLRSLNAAGFYWFPGRRCWDRPQSPSVAAAALGSIKSEAKAESSRRNGQRGGRPRRLKQ